MVIISVLAAIAYPRYQDYVENARRTEVQGDIMMLASSLETYRSQKFVLWGSRTFGSCPKLGGE